MKRKNLHVYTLISDLKNVPYILLVPIFLSFIFNNISILMLIILYCLCILITFSLIYLKFYSYINKTISQVLSKIKINSGIFNKKETIFDIKKACSIYTEQTLVTRLIGAYKTFINFHTPGYILKKGVYLNKNQISNLVKYVWSKNCVNTIYEINFGKLMILSLSYYNIISGVIIGIPLLKKIKNLLRYNVNLQHIIQGSRLYGVAPAIASVFYLAILIPFVVFSAEMLKFWGLSVYKSQNAIYIKHGKLSPVTNVINLSHIYALSYRTTLINIVSKTKLVYLHTIVNVSKYSSILVALVNSPEIDIFNELVDKNLQYEVLRINPSKKTLANHLYFPLSIYFPGVILSLFLPSYIKIFSISLMSISVLWVLFIRIYSFERSSIVLYSKSLHLTGYSGLSLINVKIPITNIQKVKIRQSIFQIFSKRCNVYFYSPSNVKEIFKIKHLNIDNVENLVETLENLYIKLKG